MSKYSLIALVLVRSLLSCQLFTILWIPSSSNGISFWLVWWRYYRSLGCSLFAGIFTSAKWRQCLFLLRALNTHNTKSTNFKSNPKLSLLTNIFLLFWHPTHSRLRTTLIYLPRFSRHASWWWFVINRVNKRRCSTPISFTLRPLLNVGKSWLWNGCAFTTVGTIPYICGFNLQIVVEFIDRVEISEHLFFTSWHHLVGIWDPDSVIWLSLHVLSPQLSLGYSLHITRRRWLYHTVS